jgi:hypothetical protein
VEEMKRIPTYIMDFIFLATRKRMGEKEEGP